MYGIPIYDVIISGAGPVGLFLASELALRHCSVLVLEKAEQSTSTLKQLPFGVRGLNTPSIEALYRRGLFEALELHKHMKNPHMGPAQKDRGAGGHFAGIQFFADQVDTSQWSYWLPSPLPPNLMSYMEEIETILTHRVESLGVTILRGMAMTGFTQSSGSVIVQATPSAAGPIKESFQAKWLVGCDGARSLVRKAGGFEFSGTEPEFTGYSAKVDILDPEKLKPGRNITTTGMYLQSQPGYLNIQDFDGGAFHGSDESITLEHIQQVLRRVSQTDVTLTALHIATTWTDRARQATAYRKGRVLLAGDAAHIHAPLGGQGLNLGLGDAMNLGWKLAATIKETAPEGLLDTYFAERHPLGEQVLDWSRAQALIMGTAPASRALYTIMKDLINTKDGATYMAGRIWGIHTHYGLGSTHPLVGHSVPNFAFEDGTTIGEHMRDGKGILLDFTSSAALQSATADYGDQLKYLSGRAKEQFGLNALLIRPDGYIAWATDGPLDPEAIHIAAKNWFMPAPAQQDGQFQTV
jgi:2-polyprenyl-6-methoxyphenol hydroxylase-like FAD-dependent oxidoreductase